jgi:alpha(1,3/1,4) fucosyltransferase
MRRRVAFLDFWPGFEASFFGYVLEGMDVVGANDDPDVILFSVFGRRHEYFLRRGCRAKLVWYTGENVYPPLGSVPLCISFLPGQEDASHLRMPLWVFSRNLDSALQVHEARLRGDGPNPTRLKFASFVASNGNAAERLRFVNILSSMYKGVTCGGRLLNNIGGPVDDKLALLEEHRFDICFENETTAGYCTEKILDSFAAGCVPIYWGDSRLRSASEEEPDFNTAAVISAHDFDSLESLALYVRRVDEDRGLFENYLRQPIFSDSWYSRLRCAGAFREYFTELLFRDSERGTRPFARFPICSRWS